MLSRERFLFPLSTKLTYVRSNPALSANCSWVSPQATRASRTLRPKFWSSLSRRFMPAIVQPVATNRLRTESHISVEGDYFAALGNHPA
jgi:hypothetical protein